MYGGSSCRIEVPLLTDLLTHAQAVLDLFILLSIFTLGLPIFVYLALFSIAVWWLTYRQETTNFKYFILLPLLFPLVTFLVHVVLY